MLTKEQAQFIAYRAELAHATEKDSRGNPRICRVNGKCQTWKTRPLEFSLPVKQGLYATGYITQDNAKDWTPVSEVKIVYSVGTRVRSYDFPGDTACYIEGIVDGYGGDVFPSDSHYRIKSERRVWEGREVPLPTQEGFVYPPMIGMFGNKLVVAL